MTSIRKLFGARLRDLREVAGLGVDDVARLAHVNRTHIYGIERGEWWASMDLIETLASIYRVEVADLFVFPDQHARHRFREMARLVPNRKLAPVVEAAEHVLGQTVEDLIASEKPQAEAAAPIKKAK